MRRLLWIPAGLWLAIALGPAPSSPFRLAALLVGLALFVEGTRD